LAPCSVSLSILLREREKLFDLFEEIAGQRMMFNYIRIGGVVREPKADWYKQAEEVH